MVDVELVPSGIESWDSLMGGLPCKGLSAIFGEAQAGKSILAAHLYYTSKLYKKYNALYLYTESDPSLQLKRWVDILNKRFGAEVNFVRVNVEWIEKERTRQGKTEKARSLRPISFEPKTWDKEKGTIFATYIVNYDDILEFHGRGVDSKVHESGKIMVVPVHIEPFITNTPIGKIIQENNVKLLVYDSVSEPLQIFEGGETNFPTRDFVEGLWFAAAQQLAAYFDLICLGIMQPTQSPRAGTKDKGRPWGGKAVKHHFKYVLLLECYKNPMTGAPTTGRTANMRKCWAQRSEWLPTMNAAGFRAIEFRQDGLYDCDVVSEDMAD